MIRVRTHSHDGLSAPLYELMLVITLTLSSSAFASAQLILDEKASSQSFTAASEYFSTAEHLSISEVRALADAKWQASPGHNFNRGMSDLGFWFRLQLKNASAKNQQRLLQIDRPYMNVIDVYQFDDHSGAALSMYELGDWRPSSNRPLDQQVFVVPVSVPAQSSLTVYVYGNNHGGPAHFIMSLWQVLDFYDNKLRHDIFNQLYIGGALILALYNLFLFMALRQRAYLYYVGYIVCYCYTMASLLGYPQWLTSDALVGVHQYGFFIGAVGLRLFIYLFSLSFLKLSSRSPLLGKLIKALIIFETGLGLALLFSLYSEQTKLFASLSAFNVKFYVVHSITALTAGLVIWARGFKDARFFTLAMSFFTLVTIINAMSVTGLIPFHKYIPVLLQLGQLLEMLLLSFALADKLTIANQIEKKLISTQKKLLSSELQKAQEQFKVEKSELASQAKSQFLASMSHEIRTPMNAILGYAQLMQMDARLSNDQREQLQIINRSGDHLLGLINDVLDMAKIEAGEIAINAQDCDLYALLDDVKVMMQGRADDKNISLNFYQAEDLPQYQHIDGAKLRQVLINVIGNAIKFTDFGGVRISAYWQAASDDQAAKLRFHIEDTGAGIDQDQFDQVFSSFTQTDSGTKNDEGTGLGMPISLKFAQLLGGDIHFTSQVNQGSTFVINITSIPAQSDIAMKPVSQRAVIGVQSAQDSRPVSELRVLIVDDNKTNRDLLAATLAPLHLTCEFAGNGEEAINAFIKHTPDIIFMDVRMPKMDGIAAIQRIRAHSTGQELPIVVVSASAFESDRKAIMAAGANHFLRKPFKTEEIYQLLQDYLALVYRYADEEDPADTADSEEFEVHANIDHRTSPAILVVDDNPVNRLLCKEQLNSLGYACDTAENGLEAIQQHSAQHYELILMDCEMPEMDGFTASQNIRHSEQQGDGAITMIIGLSAHKDEAEKSHALAAGMNSFLCKPVDLAELRDCLNHYLVPPSLTDQ